MIHPIRPQNEQIEWHHHRLGERIDSFNISDFRQHIEALIEEGHYWVALELQQTKFLSITGIQLLVWWADRVQEKGGRLMLVEPTEKLKRQITIFGSLDQMIVTKSRDLPAVRSTGESPAHDASLGS